MSRFLDDIQHRLQDSQGNDKPELKAYRLGYVDGLRAVVFAENLPDSFRNWLEMYFTRCRDWEQIDLKEEAPPEITPYQEMITVKTPLLSLDDLDELPCANRRCFVKIDKIVQRKILKEAILEVLRDNGGSMFKDELYQSLGVETDE